MIDFDIPDVSVGLVSEGELSLSTTGSKAKEAEMSDVAKRS